jgi:UV DNA damage endonuclease
MKRTFEAKGMDYVSDLTLLNSRDIIKILEWNRQHGIKLFRLSSSIIPWGNNIDITELKDYKEIKSELKKNWFLNKDIKNKEEQKLINTLYKCFDSI